MHSVNPLWWSMDHAAPAAVDQMLNSLWVPRNSYYQQWYWHWGHLNLKFNWLFINGDFKVLQKRFQIWKQFARWQALQIISQILWLFQTFKPQGCLKIGNLTNFNRVFSFLEVIIFCDWHGHLTSYIKRGRSCNQCFFIYFFRFS